MRVEVLVVGFNRSLSSTIDSIFENVLKPARALRATTKISFVLSSTRDAIDNPRSDEQGQPEQQIPRGYRFNKSVEWDQHDIELATEGLSLLAKQNGNPWPKDDSLSLRNVI
jgi:hypothetical protein